MIQCQCSKLRFEPRFPSRDLAFERHRRYIRGMKKTVAGRTYKVTVDHVLCGMTHDDKKYPPEVSWAGTGGYWCRVDINNVPEANK